MLVKDQKLVLPLYNKFSAMLNNIAEFKISTPEALEILNFIETRSETIKPQLKKQKSIESLIRMVHLIRAILQS